MVAVRSGHDVDKRMGIPETGKPDNPITSPSLREEVVGTTLTLEQHWDELTMNLINVIEFEEGYRSKPYVCSEGYVTVGFGTKLYDKTGVSASDFPITVTRSIAAEWLHSEIAIKDLRLSKSMVSGVYNKLDDNRQAIIMSMAYQMGTSGLLNFRKMWLALASENYAEAAKEMLDSKWARQTPERAERHARVILGESLVDVYPNRSGK